MHSMVGASIATSVLDRFWVVFGAFWIVFGLFCIVFAPFFSVFSRRGATAVPRRHRDAVMAAWRRHSASPGLRQPRFPEALTDGPEDEEHAALCGWRGKVLLTIFLQHATL